MVHVYSRSKSSDFSNQLINLGQLHKLVVAETWTSAVFHGVNYDQSDTIKFVFSATLSAGEITTLDTTVIGGYTYTAPINSDINALELDSSPTITDHVRTHDGNTHQKVTLGSIANLADHNQLTNYDSNKHFDHSLISIIAGEGMIGGGTIIQDLTLNINIPGLPEDTTPDLSTDYIVTYDTNNTSHKKVLLNKIGSVFGTEYQYAEDLGLETTNSTTWFTKMTFTTTSLPLGTYCLQFYVEFSNEINDKLSFARLYHDTTTTELAICNSATKVVSNIISFKPFTCPCVRLTNISGVHIFKLDMKDETGSYTAAMQNARMQLFRIS